MKLKINIFLIRSCLVDIRISGAKSLLDSFDTAYHSVVIPVPQFSKLFSVFYKCRVKDKSHRIFSKFIQELSPFLKRRKALTYIFGNKRIPLRPEQSQLAGRKRLAVPSV
jgi:hypothetical protein